MAKKTTFDYDLIVIGTGAGGSAAATIAARAGKRVAVVEAETFGGESPNWGDIPTKALLHAATVYDEAKRASRFGLRTSTVGYNYPSLLNWKDVAVKRTGAGGNRRYYENEGISAYNGAAHFLSPHEISVNRRHLSAEYFLIATGSHIEVPNIPGLENAGYQTPRSILQQMRPPRSLFIIGGGSVGVEFAQLMAIFGTKVTIGEIASRILPSEDEEVGELIGRILREQKGVTCLTETRIVSVVKDGIGKRVTFTRGGVEKSIHVDDVLVTTGRTPTVDVGLENASVAYTPKGIETNEFLQTSAKHIFAAGDVLGRHKQTHTALLESRVVANNILHPKSKLAPDYTATPRLTFTFPGVASVGLSEDDCLRRDLPINKGMSSLNIVARSNVSDFRDGFVKIVADKRGIILGATIVAPHAAEMIHELVLAIKHQMTATDIANTPHAFLSWNEAIRVAASRITS